VSKAIKAGKGYDLIEKQLKRLGKTEESHVGTVVNTIEFAHVAVGALETAVENGAVWFEYAGPEAGARPWCKKMLGKVFHIDEIRNMINDFGQSALIFRGGWNCRHRWNPISSDEAKRRGLKIEN